MRYYPAFLALKGIPCVVLGGGRVAERKVMGLVAAGASVTVISPRATAGLMGLHADGSIRLVKRRYGAGDLSGYLLAVAAAGTKRANRAASREALSRGMLVNVVDEPASSNFVVPAIVDRGGLVIAISTSGEAPSLARALREDIERAYGPEYSAFVEILGAVRRKLMGRAWAAPGPPFGSTAGRGGATSGQTPGQGLKNGGKYDKKERVMKALVHSHIPLLLRRGDLDGVSLYLEGLLGKGYTLSGLGLMKGRFIASRPRGRTAATRTKKSR
jgi:precorrin-2 dehydrogenase/sirohydrochlorin ferrochelatase